MTESQAIVLGEKGLDIVSCKLCSFPNFSRSTMTTMREFLHILEGK